VRPSRATRKATPVTADFRLQLIGPPHFGLLSAMYDRFDPLGEALGLPPLTWEARQNWIGSALRQLVNVAAFANMGDLVGHSFVVEDNPGSAEIAVFVHQGFRRRGIGAALVQWMLEWGRAVKLDRAWAVTASESIAAMRLLTSSGFRLTASDRDIAELEIDLRPMPNTRQSTGELLANKEGF